MNEPLRVLVFCTLFPSERQPNAGVFIRERMFRVGKELPLAVIAPVPWFPFQKLIRFWRPHFRPSVPYREHQQGFEVLRPRFFSIPGLFKSLDGLFMAIGCLPAMWRLRHHFAFDIIDAHFAYPDGYAATLLGLLFKVPVTITLRGTEVSHSHKRFHRRRMVKAMQRATRIFAVANALKRLAVSLGLEADKIMLVGNGVDTTKFFPSDKAEARTTLGLPKNALVLVTVGGLVERKGFHRVIELMPALSIHFPNLHYLVVGGPCPEGDWGSRLKQMVAKLGLSESVHFLGPLSPEALRVPLSAADVFVLPSRNEGWANVLLEAMACGLPVIATHVGGNREVVSNPALGKVVPFGDTKQLQHALEEALRKHWDRRGIITYARQNSWEERITTLVREFRAIASA